MCKDCEALRAENQMLRETLVRLRRMIHDMGGEKINLPEDPYEDETPLITWESDK